MISAKPHSAQPFHFISVLSLSITGLEGTHNYYKCPIPVSDGSQIRTFLLSYDLSLKLWRRYVSNSKQSCSTASTEIGSRLLYQHDKLRDCQMPGEGCHEFLMAVQTALHRKYIRNDIITTWIASSSIYKLWRYTSHVSNELFADCFNESGVLNFFCSSDNLDVKFGSLGKWHDVESEIEGGAGNPPSNKDMIATLITRFDAGVHGHKPYCRLAILPLGDRYKVLTHSNSLISEGHLIVSIPGGSFPFMNEQDLLSRDHLKPKAHRYQSVGIFVWCNRQYLLKHSPPTDIEEMYLLWIERYLYNVENVVLHKDAFLRAFPPDMCSAEPLAGFYCQELMSPD